MNTYQTTERKSRFKFNDNAVLALLLGVCLLQIADCYSAATGAVRYPEKAAVSLRLPDGTAVAHGSAKTNSAIASPAPDSRG